MSRSSLPGIPTNDDGFALMFVLLIAMAVAAIAIGASTMQSNTGLISRYRDQHSVLETVANAGLEVARAGINNDTTYPASGFVTLEDSVPVVDVAGNTIPNVVRSTWVGPTGITSGQFGVFGSIVVEATDSRGNRVVRRQEIRQESFAKFAYFTNVEPSNIYFGGGDQLFGPVHSNDIIKIHSTGATFWAHVTTAKTVSGSGNGTFAEGYTQHAPVIAMPQTSEFAKLKAKAQEGNTYVAGDNLGDPGQATTRVEFVAIDLDGDGQVNGVNEGFIRVYKSSDAAWVVADMPGTNLRNSQNCGHYDAGIFVAANDHPNGGTDNWKDAVTSNSRRCYLGGSDSLWTGFVASDGTGDWLAYGGPSFTLPVSRPDAAYLIPINRTYNPTFKGVIFVEGNVAVSGTVRGNVTLAATGNIVIADDVTYATDPGAGTCNDLLGLFAQFDVVLSDNTLNAPKRGEGTSTYYTYDDTKDEFVHAIVLALGSMTVDNYASGSTVDESCESTPWGRGCFYLTGGVIQTRRGAVGRLTGTGYIKRYSYDACAATNPPPYFPTTGHFTNGVYYEVDPSDFDPTSLFQALTP